CDGGECLSVEHGHSFNEGEAITIARAGDYVLWAGGWERALYRTDVDGNSFVTLVSPEQTDHKYITMIAADPDPSGYVFFTDYDGGAIGRASIETGQTVTLAKVPDAIVPGARAMWGRILVHGDFVYWALDFQAHDRMTGAQVGKHIWRAPREPQGALPVEAEMVVKTEGAFGIAGDDDYLYFGNNDPVAYTYTLERVAWADLDKKDVKGDPDASTHEVLASGDNQIGDLAVDNERVFWAVMGTVRFQDKALPKSLITTLPPADTWVWGIATDSRDVYFTSVGDGSAIQGALWRMPLSGAGQLERLYTTEPDGISTFLNVFGLTEDCDTVYFAVPQGGVIRRITK
ncbi:MAG: hypothetical protein R3B70_49260, partial [Polyangiaceae bacterium]